MFSSRIAVLLRTARVQSVCRYQRALTRRALLLAPVTTPRRGRWLPAAAGAALAAGCGLVYAEVGESAAGGANWGQLVGRLSAGGWDVSHSKRVTGGGSGARYELSLRAAAGADMHAVLVALLAAFADGASTARVSAADAPSSTALTIVAGEFTVEVAVPRISTFDARVTLTVDVRGAVEPVFSPAQVAALERAARVAATPAGRDERTDLAIYDDDGNHIACRNPHAASKDVAPAASEDEARSEKHRRARERLTELGVDVLDPAEISEDWDSVAGYDDVKRRIEDALVLPLQHPDVFDGVARGTRARFASNVPAAVLYSGPPGCGKTLCARVLAASVGVPFVHVPLEALLSKYYGETTRRLASVLDAANDLGRCIVFVDEADSLAMARDGAGSEVHEVTRRTLSVLLRFLDGVDGPRDAILLAATNCADSLDPALLSRFDVVVKFPPPDEQTRSAILARYAKHLSEQERALVARVADGFSGRELLDMCEDAERAHAGRVVRGAADSASLPTVQEYVDAVKAKTGMTVKAVEERNRKKRSGRGLPPMPYPISA